MSLTVNGSDRPLPLTPSQPAVNQCDHLPPPAVNHLSAADEHLHVPAVSESAGGLAVAVGGLQFACDCGGALASAQSHLTHRLIDTDPAHTCPAATAAAAAADSDDDDAVYCDAAADDVTCWSRDAATPPPAELAGRLRALWLGGWSWRQSCGWCVLLLVSSLLMALLVVVGLFVVASYLLLESDADLALVHAARSLPQLCTFYRDRYAPWRDRYLAAPSRRAVPLQRDAHLADKWPCLRPPDITDPTQRQSDLDQAQRQHTHTHHDDDDDDGDDDDDDDDGDDDDDDGDDRDDDDGDVSVDGATSDRKRRGT